MSGLRCWPGATAYISGLPEHLMEANGRVVTLKHEPPALRNGAWIWWLAEPVSVVVTGSFRCSGRTYWIGESILLDGVADERLTPLTPPPGTDCITTDADKPQPVEA